MFNRRKRSRSSSHRQVCPLLETRASIYTYPSFILQHDADLIGNRLLVPRQRLTRSPRCCIATIRTCISICTIRRQPCILKIPTFLQQSFICGCRCCSAQSHTNPNTGGKCPDEADGPATGLDTVANQSSGWASLGQCKWPSAPIK